MNNLPWGAENDTSAPYNEETIRESLLKTMREFNVEYINVWVY